ncbi:hypothetical protein ACPF7Z_11550 [Halomonas sp. GXIMD04776]|uniref:hypothetical protein n=1 Tax=Halomonas sp. GXIMD04776 TaxID=3415605 RepID=UPI003CA7B2F1
MQQRVDDRARFPLLQVLMTATLIILVIAVWYALNETLRGGGKDIAWYPSETSCDLHRDACHAQLGEHGDLRLALEREIAPLEPVIIDVWLQNIEAERVVVMFDGRDMDMGINRFVLDDVGDGHFRGLGQFGVCSLEVMPWRIKVLVESAQGRLGSWFDIDVQRRS